MRVHARMPRRWLFGLPLLLLHCGSKGESMPRSPTPDAGTSTSLEASTYGDSTDGSPCASEPMESPAELSTASGTIRGTLLLPAGCSRPTVALIVPGSGPTDRNGNSAGITADAYRWLANSFAEQGVASVRYDKRGLGGSADAREPELRFEPYVADVAAWITRLAADPRFAGVMLAGHSEGSLIGILAIERAPVAAFLSLAGPGRPFGEVLREQIGRGNSGALLTRANQILDELEAGREVADVPPELALLFDPGLQPYLISIFQYDPAIEIAKLTAPTLIAQGTTDFQVSVMDAEKLAAARPDAQLLLVSGMNHMLKSATLDLADQQLAYTDPTRPLAPDLVQGIDTFLAALPR
jgi:pimeloyl-ACP methyl ester carboxylesterase